MLDMKEKKEPFAYFPSAHHGPVTGLAFSPINSAFAVTVGLDKTINLFDISNKKLVI